MIAMVIAANNSFKSRLHSLCLSMVIGFIFATCGSTAVAQNWDTNGWVFGGSASWFFQSNVTFNGGQALQSGPIADGQETYAETQVVGPAVMRFHLKVSSQKTWDDLRILTNGSQVGLALSGEVDWRSNVFYFPSGTNVVRWTYRKLVAGSAGMDAAWIDQFYAGPPAEPMFLPGPANTSVFESGTLLLSPNVIGAEPISYQWQFNQVDIPDATNLTLMITNVSQQNAGNYRLRASNSFAVETSTNATVTVLPFVQSSALEVLWSKPVNSTPWLAESNDRSYLWHGIAYNRAAGHVLVATRAAGTNIWVLDADTGEELHTLNLSGVFLGERFPLNLVRVAEDGAVYACNLRVSSDATNRIRIYRWADDSPLTIPQLVWEGEPSPAQSPALSWGDSMDVRGSGEATQIVMTHYVQFTSAKASIITPASGINSAPAVVPLPGASSSGPVFVAFGAGDTFWVKGRYGALHYYSFEGTNAVLLKSFSMPMSAAGIDVSPSESKIAVNGMASPHFLAFYDIGGTANELTWADSEFFTYPLPYPNASSLGAIDISGDRIYAINDNNGILALKFAPTLRLTRNPDGTITLTWSGGTLQSAGSCAGPFQDEFVSSPHTLSPATPQRFFRIRN